MHLSQTNKKAKTKNTNDFVKKKKHNNKTPLLASLFQQIRVCVLACPCCAPVKPSSIVNALRLLLLVIKPLLRLLLVGLQGLVGDLSQASARRLYRRAVNWSVFGSRGEAAAARNSKNKPPNNHKRGEMKRPSFSSTLRGRVVGTVGFCVGALFPSEMQKSSTADFIDERRRAEQQKKIDKHRVSTALVKDVQKLGPNLEIIEA